MKILITGTTQGIGKQLYEDLSKDNEVYTVNRKEFLGNNFICDLSNLDEVNELCLKLKDIKFDALINNAGGSYPVEFENLTTDDIIKRINLNFVAPTLLIQTIIQNMKDNNFGRIINISSVTAKTPVPYLHIYSASKSALNSLTQSLAVYYSNCNITINAICPGAIDTASSVSGREVISKFKGLNPSDYQRNMIASTGLNRMLTPIEVSNFVKYLLSPGASCISGQTFNICGTMEVK